MIKHFDSNFGLYSIFIVISLIVGIISFKFIKFSEEKNKIDIKYILPVMIIGAIIGAKIPLILSYGLRKEILWTGKSYFGALIGAFLIMQWFKNKYNLKGNFGNRFAIPLAISAGIGKIGCFLHGCCSGKPTDFFIKVKNFQGIDVHPVQIYESIFQFFMALILIYLYKKNKYRNCMFLIYIISYSVFRFFIEFIRIEPRVLFGLTIYQIMTLIFTPIFILTLNKRIKNA